MQEQVATRETIRQAARLSKSLNREENLNSEHVAIWADGSVSLTADECRGDGAGWEYPIATIYQPYRIADVEALLADADEKDQRKRFQIREDSGASKIIEADSLQEALEAAEAWAAEGDYDERVMVSVYADEIDEDDNVIRGEHASGEVAAGPEPEPEPTECGDDDDDHDWQRPIELVGGLTENPGVFSTGGTRFDFHSVCAKCGMYKHSWDQGQQRNPGQLDEGVKYEPADERSLAWVAEQ